MKQTVYLCSRVAHDARPLNDRVAASLEAAGYDVYVPHRQAPNNLSKEDIEEGRYDRATIFQFDFAAMRKADICVVVGRFGKDCSWELGYFAATKIPVYFVPAGDETYKTSPMLLPTLMAGIIDSVDEAGKFVKALEFFRSPPRTAVGTAVETYPSLFQNTMLGRK